jgi:hypothetical protein
MKLDVIPALPTLIGRLHVSDADAMNQELAALILAKEASYGSVGRNNIGRCHSRSDLLNSPEPAVVKADTSDVVAGNEMTAGTAAMSAIRQ